MNAKRPLPLAIAVWMAALLLAGLTWHVWVAPAPMALDLHAAELVAAWRDDSLRAFMRTLHAVQGKLVAVLVLVWLVTLARRRQWHAMWLLAAVVPGGMLVNKAFKWVVERPRPDLDADVGSHGYSYPSGHVAAIAVLCCYLVVETHRLSTKLAWRFAATVAALCVVALVAFSRVYLGVHHATDVLASLLLGIVWTGLCLYGARALAQAPRSGGP